MKKSDKAFFVGAAAGLTVAAAFAVADRGFEMIMPDWLIYIWPSLFMLGAISGQGFSAGAFGVVAVSALLNGFLYGLIAWTAVKGMQFFRQRHANS